MSNWEPYSQHIWPNWKLKTGPQLIMRISAAYRAHFPPLIVRARARIIPCAFPQHIVHISRRLSCAHGPASYRAHSAVDGAEIPQSMVRKFRTIGAISAGHSALPQVPCACARSSAQLAHGPMRVPPSIWCIECC